MKYIKGVYPNRYKRNLFNISMFLFLLMFLVLAVFVTVQAVVHIPRATINRISNKESGAKPGDIIRYTVKVKRLDTVQTERIRLVESLEISDVERHILANLHLCAEADRGRIGHETHI